MSRAGRRLWVRRGLHGAVVHEIAVRILKGDVKPGEKLKSGEELSRELW
jgi:DNA-binding FadR family transcriptional regulator